MLFELLFLAHLLGDFVFQTEGMAMHKSGLNRAMWKHAAIHFILFEMALIIFALQGTPMGFWRILGLGLLVSGIHMGVDVCKVWLDGKVNQRWSLYTFMGDQVAHVVVVLIVLWIPFHAISLSSLYDAMNHFIRPNHDMISTRTGHILVFAIMLILVTKVSGIIVDKLTYPKPKQNKVLLETKITETISSSNAVYDTEGQCNRKTERTYLELDELVPPRGVLIGYLERLIIMCLVYGQAYPAIGFIAAAKTFVRFKQLDHREFAEYFLVGTLSSMLLGLLWGHVLRCVL